MWRKHRVGRAWCWRGRRPNGLELSRSAEAGGATGTLALAGDESKLHADTAGLPNRPLDSPRLRAPGTNLSARPPSRLQRVVGRRHSNLVDLAVKTNQVGDPGVG
jgi:hypothetical protein